MVFQRVDPGEKLLPNRFRILEPRINACRQRKVWALDLVLLLLVGFDDAKRLGMGGGFMTAAWPTSLAAKAGASRRCWGWPMSVRRSIGWRRRVGMCRWRARSLTSIGISQRRHWSQRRLEVLKKEMSLC